MFAFRCPTMELVVRPTRLQTREGGNWVVDAPIPMFQLNALGTDTLPVRRPV